MVANTPILQACALTCDSSTLLEPVLLANYPPGSRSHPIVDCTAKVWEAARATYANPDVQGVFKKGAESALLGACILTSVDTQTGSPLWMVAWFATTLPSSLSMRHTTCGSTREMWTRWSRWEPV